MQQLNNALAMVRQAPGPHGQPHPHQDVTVSNGPVPIFDIGLSDTLMEFNCDDGRENTPDELEQMQQMGYQSLWGAGGQFFEQTAATHGDAYMMNNLGEARQVVHDP